jgi:pimeloyl-ACP methyl ester carboxylesterase
MLGVGFSDRSPHLDCSLRASTERFLQFVEVAGISSFDLLGTSHGGAIAIRAAATVPRGRLQRQVLVAPVNPWSAHGRHLAPFLGSTLGSALFRGTIARMPYTWDTWLKRLYGDPRRIAPGTLEGYAAPYKIPGTFEYGLSVVRHWTRDLHELEFLLPKIANVRTLLIWGSHDRAVYPRSADALRQKLHDCELAVLEGAGHLPYEECPAEFNAVLLRFLLSEQPS